MYFKFDCEHCGKSLKVREELAGEHIDVVRYNEDPEVLIPNALQPAEVEQVLLCDMIGRAIVLVQEDQLSLAIGRRGQNVRLASKLCGWDIEIMTGSELEEQIERAVEAFSQLEGMTADIAQSLVEQGYLSYDDLSVIEPDAFVEMSGLSEEQVDQIVEEAEAKAEEAEEVAAQERQARRERERLQSEAEAAGIAEPEAPAAADVVPASEAAPEVAGEEAPSDPVEGASADPVEATPAGTGEPLSEATADAGDPPAPPVEGQADTESESAASDVPPPAETPDAEVSEEPAQPAEADDDATKAGAMDGGSEHEKTE